MKKILSLVLALTLAMSLCLTAFAAESPSIHQSDDPMESVSDSIDVTATYEKPEDVVVHKYYVTVSWAQSGTIKYTAGQDTYTWNTTDLVYNKTENTEPAKWEVTDAKVVIIVENKSDMKINAAYAAAGLDGLTVTGAFDDASKNGQDVASAATQGLSTTVAGEAQKAEATYSITNVEGEIAAAGTIATLTVTISPVAETPVTPSNP